jgi:heavy metal translocating P-type ATPase
MFFEITLLGLAYAGSKFLDEDGEAYKKIKSFSDTAKETLFYSPSRPTVAKSDRQERDSREELALEESLNHNKDISIFSTGALALGNVIPLAGPLGMAAYVYALAPHLRVVEDSLRKNRRINVDSLFLFADVLALLSGSYIAAAFSLYLIQTGKLGVLRATDSSRKHIQHLFSDIPDKVWVVQDGIEIEASLKTLKPDDIVVLHGGKVIPVDGVITEGFAGIDQQALTGESQLAEKGPGDRVFANTILMNGRILVKVEKSGAETTANQIAEILFKSIDYKSQNQLAGERWADALTTPMFYTSLVLLPLIGPVSTTVFINAHIGMRIRILAPMVTLKYISLASREGLLVKDGRALEKFLDIDTILFDKTGTLTYEEPEVTEIISADTHTVEEIIRYAAIAEQKLAHPIAKAILNKANELKVSFPDIDDSCYSIGYGIRVESSGETIQAGSLRYLEGEDILISGKWHVLQESEQQCGGTFIFLAVNRDVIGALQLQPRTRHDMTEVIARLRQQGIKYMAIVSGDRDIPTRLLADQLGMDGYFANVLPQKKAEIVTNLQNQGKKVCFIGDGINDSMALKQADVSISLAGANTIAKDMAEIVLMDGHIGSINELHEISRDLEKNLLKSLKLSIAPGFVNVLGAFMFQFNTLTSLLVNASFGFVAAFQALPPKDEAISEPPRPGDSTPQKQDTVIINLSDDRNLKN